MSVTLSDEEKRSLEFDKHSTDHLDAAPVSIFFPLISPPLGRKGLETNPDIICLETRRAFLSRTMTTQILTQRPVRLRMSPHIQKSVLPLPTQMIPRCRRLPSVLGSSVSSGPSSFPA